MKLSQARTEPGATLPYPSEAMGAAVFAGSDPISETGNADLINAPVERLRPHPSYVLHNLAVASNRLSALATLQEMAWRVPLIVTQNYEVLDGYARWELARRKGVASIPCLMYQLSDDESLRWLIQFHSRSDGLNDFTRILLALDREPALREVARANQQVGGQAKLPSNLTEAERCDVRHQIATLAGVSVGNVSKVKEIRTKAEPEIVQALKKGEIQIHRAWQWARLPATQQRSALEQYRSQRGLGQAIRKLANRHKRMDGRPTADNADLIRLLRGLESRSLEPVNIFVLPLSGRSVFLTEELIRSLAAQKEFQV